MHGRGEQAPSAVGCPPHGWRQQEIVMTRFLPLCAILACTVALDSVATELIVRDTRGMPLSGAMVSRSFAQSEPADTSDNGYPAPGMRNIAQGRRVSPDGRRGCGRARSWRCFDVGRATGVCDQRITAIRGDEQPELILEPEVDAQKLADSKPANLWLSLLDFEGNKADREHFLLHCGFCHQQASPFMRRDRSSREWMTTIDRMNRYGAQSAHDFREPLAQYLHDRYRQLLKQPGLVPDFAWDTGLESVEITEWAIGDSLSQMHDFISGPTAWSTWATT